MRLPMQRRLSGEHRWRQRTRTQHHNFVITFFFSSFVLLIPACHSRFTFSHPLPSPLYDGDARASLSTGHIADDGPTGTRLKCPMCTGSKLLSHQHSVTAELSVCSADSRARSTPASCTIACLSPPWATANSPSARVQFPWSLSARN